MKWNLKAKNRRSRRRLCRQFFHVPKVDNVDTTFEACFCIYSRLPHDVGVCFGVVREQK